MLKGLPAPERDYDSAPFWDSCDEGVLRLPVCEDCSTPRWPPGPACPSCAGMKTRWVDAKGTGAVYSWVVVHVPLDEALADQLPYAVGLVELDEGVRIVSTIEGLDPDGIEAGMRVAVRFDEPSGGQRVPTFVPAAEAGR